jgi:hypothetical protein
MKQEEKKREFAIAVGRLRQEAIARGLYQQYAIEVLEAQLAEERSLKASYDANARSY